MLLELRASERAALHPPAPDRELAREAAARPRARAHRRGEQTDAAAALRSRTDRGLPSGGASRAFSFSAPSCRAAMASALSSCRARRLTAAARARVRRRAHTHTHTLRHVVSSLQFATCLN